MSVKKTELDFITDSHTAKRFTDVVTSRTQRGSAVASPCKLSEPRTKAFRNNPNTLRIAQ